MNNLGSLVQPVEGTGFGSGNQLSLSEIASGFLSKIAGAAGDAVSGKITNATRSQNTQPVPDLSAAAAKPQVSSFLDAQPFGVSMPILLVGIGALAYIAFRR